jgi:hypothetical protein
VVIPGKSCPLEWTQGHGDHGCARGGWEQDRSGGRAGGQQALSPGIAEVPQKRRMAGLPHPRLGGLGDLGTSHFATSILTGEMTDPPSDPAQGDMSRRKGQEATHHLSPTWPGRRSCQAQRNGLAWHELRWSGREGLGADPA